MQFLKSGRQIIWHVWKPWKESIASTDGIVGAELVSYLYIGNQLINMLSGEYMVLWIGNFIYSTYHDMSTTIVALPR